MSEGSETILNCASCGKSFKGSPGSKKFHCASCHEVTGVGGSAQGGAGKILCGNCWSSMELREELSKTSQTLLGADGGTGAADQHLIESNRALEERLTEIQTRFILAEEGRAAALRERDISTEARAKLEKTLAEFLGKFASVREAEVVAMKERDSAREQCRALDRKMKDLNTQLQLAQETEAAAMAERNGAATARAEIEGKFDDLQRQYNSAQESLTQERGSQRKSLDARIMELEAQVAQARESESKLSVERTTAMKAKAELELKASDLQTRVASLQEKLEQAQNDAPSAELENRVGDLHGELVAAQVENMQICAERDMAVTARQELDAKLADLNNRLAAAHEAQVTAAKERDEALASAKASSGDNADVAAVRMELNRLREAAVTALEPLGLECNTKMKDLMAETELVLGEARQARDQALERFDSLEKMLGSLRGNINLARRHVTGRVSMVLGSPAGESGFSPSMAPASGSGHNKAAGSVQNKSAGNKSGLQSAPVSAAGE